METMQVYEYDELDEKVKERVLKKLAYINVEYDWWDFTYADARMIGLEITEFDTYRMTRDGNLLESVGKIVRRIVENHGKLTGTYQIAMNYYRGKYRTGNKDVVEEFKQDLLDEYFHLLKEEYEYLMSVEAIEETIRINEYKFTSAGIMI